LVEPGAGRLSRRKLSRRQREALAAYLFLLPWLVGMVGITLGPMLASLWISFTRYNLLSLPHWIGLGNYDALLHDPLFASAVKVTLLYVGVSVPIQIGFALFLAVLLNRGMKALGSGASRRRGGASCSPPCHGFLRRERARVTVGRPSALVVGAERPPGEAGAGVSGRRGRAR
jgi:hypothetical protein